MEILNKNQRDGALWRQFGLGAIIAGAIVLMLLSMHWEYKYTGYAELKNCEEELNKLKGQKFHAANQLSQCRDSLRLALNRPEDAETKILRSNLAQETGYKEKWEKDHKQAEKDIKKCWSQSK
jgi:hypothetical protein